MLSAHDSQIATQQLLFILSKTFLFSGVTVQKVAPHHGTFSSRVAPY